MKKTLPIHLALFVMLLTMVSCSSGTEPKTISPTSTEFPSGEIAKYVEIVNQPAELSFSEQKGSIDKQWIRLKTKLKATDYYDEIDEYDYRDMSFTKLLSVAMVSLVDDNGNSIRDLSIRNEDILKLKKLISGESDDDEEEIIFEDSYFNHKGAVQWYKETTHFTPYLTGDIYFPTKNSNTTIVLNEEEDDDDVVADVFDEDDVVLPSQLKGKVEVIKAKKSVGKYGNPTVEITFNLISTVDTGPLCSRGGQMWIVGVGQDEDGVDVKELLPNYKEWRSDDMDGTKFKDFLEGDPDDTITLEFVGSKDDSSNVASDLQKVERFKLRLTN